MLPNHATSIRQRFHSHFIWRSTGFPLETLEQFGMDAFAAEIREHLAAGPSRGGAGRYADVLPPAAVSHFDDGFRTLRRRLHRVVGSCRVQMAVASSSPTAARRLRFEPNAAEGRRTGSIRRRERLGMRYLQRLVSKCETSAFFGPVATGRIARTAARVEFQHDLAGYRGCAFLGERFLAAIVRLLRQDTAVLSELRIRRRSGVAFAGRDRIVHPRFGALCVRPQAVQIVRQASSAIAVNDVLATWRGTRAEALSTVAALLVLGVISDDLEAVWHSRNPVAVLRPHVRRAQTRTELEALLDVLDQAMTTWPGDIAEDKGRTLEAVAAASALVGLSDASESARFYGGHLPIFEDGVSPGASLRLDDGWAEPFLHDLDRVVRSCLAPDARCAAAARRSIARRLALQGEHTLTLAELLSRQGEMGDDPGDGTLIEAAEVHGPLITSPDVLIAARDLNAMRRGECEWVLSECHSSVSPATFFVRPMPDAAAWLGAIDEFLVRRLPNAQLVAVTGARENKTDFGGVLNSARYLEAGLAAPPEADTIDMAELEVEIDEDMRLVRRDGKLPVTLLPGHLGGNVPLLDCFRTPRYQPLGQNSAHNGRETLGGVTYRRARWTLSADGLPPVGADVLEVFCWAQAERIAQGLPRWIFARPASERKPLCIDLSNPFLCEELQALLRRDPSLIVEEMHPAPDDAWVQGADGRYLTELRLLYATEGFAA